MTATTARTFAVVLSAGRSTRMGQTKALLHLDGKPLIQVIIEAAKDGGCDGAIVVTGESDDRLAGDLLRASQVRAIGEVCDSDFVATIPGVPNMQSIDSLRKGLQLLPAAARLLLWPVDFPFANARLVRSLLRSFSADEDHIAVPRHGDRRGHPVLFGAPAAAELQTPLGNSGARAVVRHLPSRVIEVPCDDHRITANLNTPEQAVILGVEMF